MTNKASPAGFTNTERQWLPLQVALLPTVALPAYYAWAGLVMPASVPPGFSSMAHLHGLVILLCLVPGYVSGVTVIMFRRKLALARHLGDAELVAAVSRIPWARCLVGALIGLAYALLFNIPQAWLTFWRLSAWELALVVGQVLVWTMIFTMLTYSIYLSRCFNAMGQRVAIDIFELSALRPFAQVGLFDVLAIVGGLVLSTFQSLDATFRVVNYIWALLVLLPAMAYLMVQPMLAVHQRILTRRNAELQDLNREILAAPKDLSHDSVIRLEVLLQRKERLQKLPTWPVDITIIQRVLIYLVIPPLAWIGAALVEMLLDGFVG